MWIKSGENAMKVAWLKERVIWILKPDSFLILHCRLKEEAVWTSILQAEAARGLGQRRWVAAHQDFSLHHFMGMVLAPLSLPAAFGVRPWSWACPQVLPLFSHFYRFPVFLKSKFHQLWLAFHVCQCKWGLPVKYLHSIHGFSLWFPWLSVNMPLLVCLPVRAAAPSTWSLVQRRCQYILVTKKWTLWCLRKTALPLPALSRQSSPSFIFICFLCTFSFPVSVLFFFPGSFVTTLLFFLFLFFSFPCCSRRKQMGREF